MRQGLGRGPVCLHPAHPEGSEEDLGAISSHPPFTRWLETPLLVPFGPCGDMGTLAFSESA